MKKSTLILLIFFTLNFYILAEEESSTQITNQCLSCHKEDDNLPDDFSTFDIHIKSGITCSDCHGGDPNTDDEDLSMSKKNGFVGVPENTSVPTFCGRCHSDIKYMRKFRPRIETDQVTQYYTSVHGIQLKKGDENVAVCTSCHTAHSILPANDPRSTTYAINIPETCNKCHGDKDLMQKYNIDSNVYSDFAKGVHGVALLEKKDVGSPACNDCHGNHGATPPGISSISNVCGMCHINNIEFFKESKMAKPFAENDYHGCEECHSNHAVMKPDDNFVGTNDDASCMQCHEEGDKGYKEAEKINLKLTNLVNVYDSAKVKLIEVRNKGMNDVDIEYILREANQSLIQARTLVHTFDSEKVGEKTNEGIQAARTALSKSNQEINDYYVRRNGLGAATVAITILIIALFIKVRDIGKTRKQNQ